ncbi:MAG: hypothetical protein K0R26_963 [Bacteroidota bacterium]|jgi:hypothetical protein|nr:hypothetical protein [Bacteroidota bacterium]
MKSVKRVFIVTGLICLNIIPAKLISQFNNQHKNYIDIGIAGGTQHHNSPMLGVYGSFGTFFYAFGRPSSIDVRVKELYIRNPEQQGTLITLTYRFSLIKGLYAGVGGAHGHQVMIGEFLTHTGSSIGGTNPHIMHSSGYNVEAGYVFRSLIKDSFVGLYPTVQVAYTHLFSASHSMPNVILNAGFKIGFRKWN